MTQEDKELIFKDLCGRLPYNVRLRWTYIPDGTSIDQTLIDLSDLTIFFVKDSITNEAKPYLRPMSSMTDKEWDIYGALSTEPNPYELYDWMNSSHFDYRGLIEKGLAIEVTEENNPYK